MTKAMKDLETGLTRIKAEMKHHAKPQDRNDHFAEKMKEFLGAAEGRVSKLRDQYMQMEKKFEELATFYCFDRKKVSMDEFFGDISLFCKDFEVWRKRERKREGLFQVALFCFIACQKGERKDQRTT